MRRTNRSGLARPEKIVTEESALEWQERTKGKKGGRSRRLDVLVFFGAFYIVLGISTKLWIYSTSVPLDLNAPPEDFSEARALVHVEVLSEQIGDRQVSSSGLKKATDYVVEECAKLVSLVNKRSELTAQVDVEDTSGGWAANIFGIELSNTFRNLTNIILYIEPKGMSDKKALLVNAHYDSAIGSPGASDCAVCVGVSLEIARSLIESKKTLETPILFLFNGGEETILQAANGFMKSSKWVSKVGAFINLESTGSGGLPLLFQYSGHWTLAAYARGAKNPRGTVIGQDFFRARLIPADTDFRMFSQDYEGSLPGIDVATVLDATAYHTNRDTLERIRRGTTQEYGDSMSGVVKEFLRKMADGVPPSEKNADAIYFDVYHSVMVFYGKGTAMWLHTVPLVIASVAWFIQSLKYQALHKVGPMQLMWAFSGICRAFASFILAMALPMILGAAWFQLTGSSMFWFSHHARAYAAYGPIALVGVLLPWQPNSNGLRISSSLLGMCVLVTALGINMSQTGLGSSYIFALFGLSAALTALVVPKDISSKFRSILSLLAPLPFTACGVCITFFLGKHIMEKLTIAGSDHSQMGQFSPELVAGALVGLHVWIATQLNVPHMVGILKKKHKRFVLGGLLTMSIFMLPMVGFSTPFSDRSARRVHLMHVHNHTDNAKESYWALSAWDPLPQESIFPKAFQGKEVRSTTPSDWLVYYPINKRCWGYRVDAPPAKVAPWGSVDPKMVRIGSSDMDDRHVRRISLELQWEKPAWGVIRLTGPVFGWSSGTQMSKEVEREDALQYTVRLSQDGIDPKWPFWIDVQQGEEVHVELALAYLATTPELETMCSEMPSWAAVAKSTVFMSSWTFS